MLDEETLERVRDIKRKRMDVLYKMPPEEKEMFSGFRIESQLFHLVRDDLAWLIDLVLPPTEGEERFLRFLRAAGNAFKSQDVD